MPLRTTILQAQERIDLGDIGDPVVITSRDGDIILKTKHGEISVNGLISRLAALEEAYMEEKLLGKQE